jgi:hypothetical protein
MIQFRREGDWDERCAGRGGAGALGLSESSIIEIVFTTVGIHNTPFLFEKGLFLEKDVHVGRKIHKNKRAEREGERERERERGRERDIHKMKPLYFLKLRDDDDDDDDDYDDDYDDERIYSRDIGY